MLIENIDIVLLRATSTEILFLGLAVLLLAAVNVTHESLLQHGTSKRSRNLREVYIYTNWSHLHVTCPAYPFWLVTFL